MWICPKQLPWKWLMSHQSPHITRRYLSSEFSILLSIHVALLLDTLNIQRWNSRLLCTPLLIPHHWCSCDITTLSGQKMMNIIIHEWAPRVYLSIVGVAIPITTYGNYGIHLVWTKIIYIVTNSRGNIWWYSWHSYRVQVWIRWTNNLSNGNTCLWETTVVTPTIFFSYITGNLISL
jgi:hypothetical protein